MSSQHPTPPDVAVADAEPAGVEAVAVTAVARAPTHTAAGGCIWLHALEYRFILDGDQYCFRSPLPEFVCVGRGRARWRQLLRKGGGSLGHNV
jgi:hypothetical protein